MNRANWFFNALLAMNLFFSPAALLPQTNVLTANYDNFRTNSNLKETTLKPSNVNAAGFGKIGSFPVNGQIYAQVLYVGRVQIPGKGFRNVVYVATMHNSVYAIDADNPGSVVALWQVDLGPAVPSSVLNFTDILPEVGILSTPVIDLDRQVMYVVSDTLEGGLPVFRMHALSLSDGHEMLGGPVVIGASVNGLGAGSMNGTLTFDALMQLQRPGLALANGIVYAAFGSHADGGNFHGWMIGYDASDLRRRIAVFNSTPNALGGSFWQAGRAPVIDDTGDIIAVTGNGDFTGVSDFGDSVLKLSGSDLSLVDFYTPDNWADLRDSDLDLGSAGVILIPGANQLLTAGKSGDLLMINSGSMGHVGAMNSSTVQSIPANPNGVYDFALWNRPDGPIVYVQEPWGPVQAYRITAGRLDATALSQSTGGTPSLFAGLAISADGGLSGTGIVWQTTGDYNVRRIPGTLHAFDAEDLSHELWNSDMVPDRDTLGGFAKFVAPTVVSGRVYVPAFSNELAIYGPLSDAGTGGAEVRITAVANGASLLTDAVSPGEVVAIFGANLGPVKMSTLQIDDAGQAAKILAGTQVLFDGVPAPLVYVSSAEIGAVVPFGVVGPTTQVRVVYRGQSSPAVAVPVVQAAPALFAQDGTGGGPGAILNTDGSVNSYDNPAERGSTVALFGTGLGQTNPLGEDGKVTGGVALPAPVLPVTVLIDGAPAEIVYSGAAPGMVQGFVQVNIRIPHTTPPAYDLRITLKVGEFVSPSTVTFSVR
ncbi:MAG TPA: hypothetical protein VH157_06445 [Bryobacteraceae bacterium]|jgi:uncharacterized protein (TIGR03437 family)|nr:hypothetical protein [Bryobacteraceae bacterium]